MKHNAKVVQMAASSSTSGVTVLSGTIDTLGFRYASLVVLGNADTVSVSTVLTHHAVEHCDTSGGTYAAVGGFVAGTDWTPTTTAVGTTVSKIAYNVDLRGKKRFLKVTFNSNSAILCPTIVGVLTNAENGVATASEQNAAFTVNG